MPKQKLFKMSCLEKIPLVIANKRYRINTFGGQNELPPVVAVCEPGTHYLHVT
jgi:hypothetical protein